ncbi:torsin-1B-like [Strongylocentrotus purpuratus]|uniref:Uncharacterized protein n=1 Tax=Strongylocentrotus purpuratus TaxID=7668 RepID=A0A7M7T4T6_STRPU|nr:torsin-1B-like [Strongylocentrotus purpuratus]
MSSSFVTVKISTKDYPHMELIEDYKRELEKLVTSKVSSCCLLPVFIFDEIERMPPGLLDSIKMFMDNHHSVEGINYRRSIFIFRSNLAASAITSYVLDQYNKGRAREDITLKEMEEVIRKDVVSKANTGLYNAKIINSHLISHFVPFLPLEKNHVSKCISAEFLKIGRLPLRVEEDEVLAQLEFFGPPGPKVFAVKGCKNVAEKVNVILYKQLRENYKRKNSEL